MVVIFYILFTLLILLTVFPMISSKHWLFRVCEFLKIQTIILILFNLCLGLILYFSLDESFPYGIYLLAITFLVLVYHGYHLFPFTPIYGYFQPTKNTAKKLSKKIKVISSNVYQFNTSYQQLIDLVSKEQPDILLTMESNSDWEKALRVLEKEYPYQVKKTLENTYGMHFYSKLKIENYTIQHFVADDIPSFEITLQTEDGESFDFYGVHPPPPSPTEEETSKERDGELMSLSKRIQQREKKHVIVTGDFNNVAWADSTQRFRRLTKLIDPRFGRGLVSTFHAKYPFLRMPIDLMYHSEHIFVGMIGRLNNIGSDHYPLCFEFNLYADEVIESQETIEAHDIEKQNEDIKEGIEEAQKSDEERY